MFTERSLQQYPEVIKAFTGLPAADFWAFMVKLEAHFDEYEHNRHEHTDRQRSVGGGRPYDQGLVIRVMLVLVYLRLHIPQAVVGWLFGCTQSDVSREMTRLLPLIRDCLPCPEVWEIAESEADDEHSTTTFEQLRQQHVLIDATEQRVSRSQDKAKRKAHYSGKRKQFTLKTQIVTDTDHHIIAISQAVAGSRHDKKLADDLKTVDHLPDGCQVDLDKGYQGLANSVALIKVEIDDGIFEERPRLTIITPHKKPRGAELSQEQVAFNRELNTVRVRIEHCIGWMKNWAILATRFRCHHDRYTLVMQTVCGMVNAQIQRSQDKREALHSYCA